MDGREPQIHKVWDFGSDGITCEVCPKARLDVGAGVVGELLSDYLTESRRRVPILGQISINGSSEYWEFLTSTGPVGPFGVPISWLPILIGEMVVPAPIRTGKFNLEDLMEVFLSFGVVLSLPVRLAPPGVYKTCALLCAASLMITFEIGIWRACGVSLPAAIPFVICGSIVMVMIGRVRLINNFCA